MAERNSLNYEQSILVERYDILFASFRAILLTIKNLKVADALNIIKLLFKQSDRVLTVSVIVRLDSKSSEYTK